MNDALAFLLVIPLMILMGALYLSPWWVRWLWPRVRWCFARKQTQRAKVIDMQEKYPLYLRDGGWFKTWDEEKYAFVKEVLWQENGKFVGLDHAIPLGDNGITLQDAKGLS